MPVSNSQIPFQRLLALPLILRPVSLQFYTILYNLSSPILCASYFHLFIQPRMRHKSPNIVHYQLKPFTYLLFLPNNVRPGPISS
jgi:hypothetical protein